LLQDDTPCSDVFMRGRGSIIVIACLLVVSFPGRAVASPGHLDDSFGGDGKVTTDFTAKPDSASDVAVQSNGRIVVVGYTSGNGGTFDLARYRSNGSLDTTFGGDGKVRTAFTDGNSAASAVAIQADRRIVVAGDVAGSFALARYDPDGSLDTTFSANGKLTTDLTADGDVATDVAIQVDGMIVAAGNTDPGEFALARYEVDGDLDPSFDGDGMLTTDPTAGYDSLWGIAIDADGKVVAVGSGNDRFVVVRYETDGDLDPTFGGDGIVTTNFSSGPDVAGGVAIQDDGAIVVAGYAGFCCEYTAKFALARYLPDGTLDDTFDEDGKVISPFAGHGGSAYDLAIQEDGRIVAGGSSGFDGLHGDFAVARYRRTGALDQTFSGNGWLTTSFTEDNDFARAVAIQPDGNVVAAGVASDGTFAVARYLA
jgi:uncharacterized delta-60 repeat protein